MKRLRDVETPSPLLEKAQALIESVEPVQDSRERMLRVRREIDRRSGAGPGGGVLAGLRRLPALALAGLVVLFGASAFAAVRYLAAKLEPVQQQDVVQKSAAGKRAHRAATQDGQESVAAAPERANQNQIQTPSPNPNPNPSPGVERAHATAHGHRGSAPRVTSHAAPRVQQHAEAAEEARASTSNSALVHRAVKALRRDGDAALAASLLEENRKRYPNGPLAEEALSLQIEAAVALHDMRARTFAREYLTRYPDGRYLDVARRALQGEGP
jgi:hypothetical protein